MDKQVLLNEKLKGMSPMMRSSVCNSMVASYLKDRNTNKQLTKEEWVKGLCEFFPAFTEEELEASFEYILKRTT